MRLAGLIAALALAALPAGAAAQDVPIALAPGEVLLSVAAEGENLSRPDMMQVSAGVVTMGRTAREALAANSEQANRLLAAVRAAGVEPRDVQTSQLSVFPQFARNEGPDRDDGDVRRITGYLARNRIQIRLRSLVKAPDIINALFEAGANDLQGPNFSLSDPAPALREARKDAVAEARREADTYAEALGMRVGRVLRVSERRSFDRGDNDNIVVTGSLVQAAPLEPGELSTRINVWIDYAMVPR